MHFICTRTRSQTITWELTTQFSQDPQGIPAHQVTSNGRSKLAVPGTVQQLRISVYHHQMEVNHTQNSMMHRLVSKGPSSNRFFLFKQLFRMSPRGLHLPNRHSDSKWRRKIRLIVLDCQKKCGREGTSQKKSWLEEDCLVRGTWPIYFFFTQSGMDSRSRHTTATTLPQQRAPVPHQQSQLTSVHVNLPHMSGCLCCASLRPSMTHC